MIINIFKLFIKLTMSSLMIYLRDLINFNYEINNSYGVNRVMKMMEYKSWLKVNIGKSVMVLHPLDILFINILILNIVYYIKITLTYTTWLNICLFT
jgi:hypothetical protein